MIYPKSHSHHSILFFSDSSGSSVYSHHSRHCATFLTKIKPNLCSSRLILLFFNNFSNSFSVEFSSTTSAQHSICHLTQQQEQPPSASSFLQNSHNTEILLNMNLSFSWLSLLNLYCFSSCTQTLRNDIHHLFFLTCSSFATFFAFFNIFERFSLLIFTFLVTSSFKFCP